MRNSQPVLPCSVFIWEGGVVFPFLFLFSLLLNIETVAPRIKEYDSVFLAIVLCLLAWHTGMAEVGGGGGHCVLK